jgi:Fur family peroxide stress response transcriptional regulator
LKDTKAHPCAEDVYSSVKEKLPSISKGTVYRILGDFKEKGVIQEIPLSVSRYDGDTSCHAHFICKSCQKVFDLSDVCKNCHVLKTKSTKVGKIENYQLYFYGKCKQCGK